MRPVYFKDNELKLIDQTKLPNQEVILSYSNYREAIQAIKDMVVRGAPAIGITGAYSVVLASQEFETLPKEKYKEELLKAMDEISQARPTAVNLMWAVNRMGEILKSADLKSPKKVTEELKAEADRIRDEDEQMCLDMGRYGASLLGDSPVVLTHCNAGALATADYGTALGVIRAAKESGKDIKVYADETRPLLQGARLTAYELLKDNIPVTLITDNMAAWLMKQNKIDAIITGADRIAANGDTANKIGTYGLSVLAKAHGIPMYIAAPSSTVDLDIKNGDEIIIEERDPEEVKVINSAYIAPKDVNVINPAFDVTPNENISAIITEKGVLYAPFTESLRKLKT